MTGDIPVTFAFEPPPTPSLPIVDSIDRFPVHRVYCVGRNYAAHAREMGAPEDRPARPMFFSKPPDAICDPGGVPYPPATDDLEHEIELVVALDRGGSDVVPERAIDLVFGYAVGVDLTRRDLQREAKERRHPWDMAKGFDYSAPCSAIRRATDIGHPDHGEIGLSVNGTPRQLGDLSAQLWTVPQVIAALSGLVMLAPGDLIFTGTPSGVGAVRPGDVIEGWIDGVGQLTVPVGRRRPTN